MGITLIDNADEWFYSKWTCWKLDVSTFRNGSHVFPFGKHQVVILVDVYIPVAHHGASPSLISRFGTAGLCSQHLQHGGLRRKIATTAHIRPQLDELRWKVLFSDGSERRHGAQRTQHVAQMVGDIASGEQKQTENAVHAVWRFHGFHEFLLQVSERNG